MALLLDSSGVAIAARQLGVELAIRVHELQAFRVEHCELRTFALREDRVARRAVGRLWLFASLVLVLVVVAAEAALPVLMTVVVGVNGPVGFTLGEDGRGENRFHRSDGAGH